MTFLLASFPSANFHYAESVPISGLCSALTLQLSTQSCSIRQVSHANRHEISRNDVTPTTSLLPSSVTTQISPHFTEPRGSPPYSQQPANDNHTQHINPVHARRSLFCIINSNVTLPSTSTPSKQLYPSRTHTPNPSIARATYPTHLIVPTSNIIWPVKTLFLHSSAISTLVYVHTLLSTL